MHFLILVALTASAAYHQLGHPRSTDSCLVAASNIASQGRQSLVVDNCIRHWFGPSGPVPSEAFYPCPASSHMWSAPQRTNLCSLRKLRHYEIETGRRTWCLGDEDLCKSGIGTTILWIAILCFLVDNGALP
jgi:hypothetical protein